MTEYYPYQTTSVQFPFPATYDWFGADEGPVLVLLHGFKQDAHTIWKIASPYIPDRYRVLAVNATFPLPERQEEGGYKVGYSWYFYDHPNRHFLVPRIVAADFVQSLWKSLGVDEKPTVVGYSQGGYIAPLVGAAIGAETVVALASSVVERDDANRDDFDYTLIHGRHDEFVEHLGAVEKFEWYKNQNPRSQFIPLDTGHRLDELIGAELKKVLS